MPAYPCIKCQSNVETSGDGRCKKCGEQRPFKCTKCDRQMGLMSLYQPEKITFRKPIYCLECGPTVEQVECRACGLSLTRSNGLEVVLNGVTHVYHSECYEQQTKTFRTVRPIAMVAGFLIFGYLGHMLMHSIPADLVFAAVGVVVGMKIAGLFAPK